MPTATVQSDPSSYAVAVTPNDATDLANGPCRALWVGVVGNVAISTYPNGASVTFVGVQGILPVNASRVWATNTTASNIVALY